MPDSAAATPTGRVLRASTKAALPVTSMLVYLLVARRLGAFESL